MHELPNVTNEIGDTWIQGIASDPVKSAEFRAVARVIEECLLSGNFLLIIYNYLEVQTVFFWAISTQ